MIITGRTSSAEPNIQNLSIPLSDAARREAAMIRTALASWSAVDAHGRPSAAQDDPSGTRQEP